MVLAAGERKRVYDELLRLRSADPALKVTTAEHLLSQRFPSLPSRETLRNWLRGATAPHTSMNVFEPRPSPELSFFLGAWLGDGWADESDGGKRLLLKARSKEFCDEFARAASLVLEKETPYRARQLIEEDGAWYLVKVTSGQLSNFANQPFKDLIPTLESNPIPFLRGFATAEGNPSVSVQSRLPESLVITVCISNTDIEYIRFARSQLEKLGYHPTSITVGYRKGAAHPIRGVMYTAKNDEWQFRLASLEEVLRFVSQVGFADSVKQDKSEVASRLIKDLGAQDAVAVWKTLFQKQGRKWSRIMA